MHSIPCTLYAQNKHCTHFSHCLVLFATSCVQVDELLADAEFKKFQKRKYVEIIKEKDRNSGTRKFSNKKKKKVA